MGTIWKKAFAPLRTTLNHLENAWITLVHNLSLETTWDNVGTLGSLGYFFVTFVLWEGYNHILHPWYFLMLGDKQDPSHRPSAARTKPWLHTGRLRDQLYGCQRKDNSMAGTKHLL